MRRLVFNLHLYGGLIAGIFVLIFGVTGSIMAFEQEIDHLLHRKLVYVTPRGRALSLVEVGTAVAKSFPNERVKSYGVSTAPDVSCEVELPGKVLYVNQYTGQVLGERKYGMGFLGFVHQLHLRLMWLSKPAAGKLIMSWAGMLMLFLLVSGLYLWWPLKRVTIAWGGRSRRVWFDLHNAAGIFSFVFLMVLTLTGVVIGFERKTTPWLFQLTQSQPAREPDIQISPPAGAKAITPDQAVELARAALPGAAPFQVNVPEPNDPYEVHLRYPEDLTPGGRSWVTLNPYSGKVLFVQSSRTAPAGTRMVILNRAVHTGDIFGIPSKAIMSLASLMAVVQVVSGVAMWWKSKRKAEW